MSIARRNIHGVTQYEPSRAWNGYNLFAPMYGRNVWIIDMMGQIVHRWEVENIPGNYGRLLKNGNLLYAGKLLPSPLPEFGGNGGQLAEYDWSGKKVWEYIDRYHSHCFTELRNDNFLIAQWRAIPDAVTKKVKGGQPGTEREGIMWGEAIQEIDRSGKILWEWLTFEHLDPEIDILCPLCPRDRWTNINALHELPDGNILVSMRLTNTILIIDRKTGKIIWRWGPGQISHQHNPTLLENGNILLFDNGAHRPYTAIDYSRVVEVNPKTGEIEWEYKENPVVELNSFICSGAQRMPNGNTVICECTKGRLFEVTREGDLVWEYYSPFYYDHQIFGTNNMIFRVYRYGADHPGIKDADLDPKRYAELNALRPRRFTQSGSDSSKQYLGVSYEVGSFVKGGH